MGSLDMPSRVILDDGIGDIRDDKYLFLPGMTLSTTGGPAVLQGCFYGRIGLFYLAILLLDIFLIASSPAVLVLPFLTFLRHQKRPDSE